MSPTELPLVCLPFAGSGAGFYRAWNVAPPGLKVVPLQLPGREELFLEEPFTDASEAAAALAPRILELVGGEAPFALFGHSLGAVLAYELARELGGRSGLRHLFVSGSPGPGSGRERRATGLDDEEFLARVGEFAGYRHAAFDDPDLRGLLLPLLRADVAMHEDYVPASDTPLPLPVTSLRGAEDGLVSRTQAEEWRSTTGASFDYRELPGSHMYLVDSPEVLLATVAQVLSDGGAAPADPDRGGSPCS
ncbi:thioesterase II family protein [Kitasatospora sp. NPDC056273]|uniref:thioesterase II family protein n=1 Tax=Kitasatospora sp. NPDC056273 TaxID=3345769 RepID=UPI0035E06D1E